MIQDPKQIGKYQVLDLLGRGGMGIVYRAVDPRIGRRVAIKTLTQGFAGDPEMLARFYEEARRTGRLSHPNIVTVYDLGDHDGVPYIVMECIDGEPLDRIIRSAALPSMATGLKIIQEICSALAYAHRNNVIHRDVKPANIFIQSDGVAKLLDFGIARLQTRTSQDGHTQTGKIIGTVAYMAPERLRNEIIDGRSDIFSTGIVLFQLLTGELPFKGEDLAVLHQILSEKHPSLDRFGAEYPAALESILEHSLAKDPDDRYSTADEMAFDLASVIAELAHGEVLNLFPMAQRLFAEEQFTEARAVLQQVLRIDAKHAGAKELLAEIQQNAIRRQRREKIQRNRLDAEVALREDRFDDSITLLEEALKLDSRNIEISSLLDQVREQKQRKEQLAAYLRQVETFRRNGDLESALAASRQAMEIDKTNSQIIAICELLAKEVEEARKRSASDKLIASARRSLTALRYFDAVKTLQDLEILDPANPDIPALMTSARMGVEQERRRHTIEQLRQRANLAATEEQLKAVALSVDQGLNSLPGEAELLLLKSELDQQLEEREQRRYVEQTLESCLTLNPEAALQLLAEASARVPDDERLHALELELKARISAEVLERHRAELMFRAQDAIGKKAYSEAVGILQSGKADGVANAELIALLGWVLEKEADSLRQETLRRQGVQARLLIQQEKYDEAIALLRPLLSQVDDQTLRVLLDEASEGREALRKRVDAVLEYAGERMEQERLSEALDSLLSQSSAIARSLRIQIAASILDDAKRFDAFRLVGALYANPGLNSLTEEAAISKMMDKLEDLPTLLDALDRVRHRKRNRISTKGSA